MSFFAVCRSAVGQFGKLLRVVGVALLLCAIEQPNDIKVVAVSLLVAGSG